MVFITDPEHFSTELYNECNFIGKLNVCFIIGWNKRNQCQLKDFPVKTKILKPEWICRIDIRD